MKLQLTLLAFLTFSACGAAGKVATLYDVLALIYRLCASEGNIRILGLQCVDYHMGAEVSEVLDQCMNSASTTTTAMPEYKLFNSTEAAVVGVDRLCDKLTLIEEWRSKHSRPPTQLTTVIGIEALGRMTCIMGNVQRPLSTWIAAFSKCFTAQDPQWSLGKAKYVTIDSCPSCHLPAVTCNESSKLQNRHETVPVEMQRSRPSFQISWPHARSS